MEVDIFPLDRLSGSFCAILVCIFLCFPCSDCTRSFHFGPCYSCSKGTVFLIRLPVPVAALVHQSSQHHHHFRGASTCSSTGSVSVYIAVQPQCKLVTNRVFILLEIRNGRYMHLCLQSHNMFYVPSNIFKKIELLK